MSKIHVKAESSEMESKITVVIDRLDGKALKISEIQQAFETVLDELCEDARE